MPGATHLKNCGVLESVVKRQAVDWRLYAAMCASPAVALGLWGLLKGLKATCYPSCIEQLASYEIAVELRVQQDGKALTSRGPGTTVEFAVAPVEQLYGKDYADEVSATLILVSISDGSEEIEAVIIVDILHRAKANVGVDSVGDNLEILASRKVKLVADMLLDEAAKLSWDLIVSPGGLGGA